MNIFIKGGPAQSDWSIEGDFILLNDLDKVVKPIFQAPIENKINIYTLNKISPYRKQGFIKGYCDVEYNGKKFSLTCGNDSYENFLLAYNFLKDIIEGEKPGYLSNLDINDHIKSENSSQQEIALSIFNNIINKNLMINENPQEMLNAITKLKKQDIFDELNNLSLKYCDDFAVKNGIDNYNLTEIISTTIPGLDVGDYFYHFNEQGDLTLLKIPLIKKEVKYQDLKTFQQMTDIFLYVDPNINSISKIILKINQINDFEITGTQLSLIEQQNSQNNPKLFRTMFSEFLFGQSYTILKGLSKNAINLSSKIEDLRIVQLIVNGNEDIKFKGIAIYFDFNRYLGKNKQQRSEQKPKQSEPNDSLEKLKKLKEMFELGLINQDEFESKKKEILDTF